MGYLNRGQEFAGVILPMEEKLVLGFARDFFHLLREEQQ